MGNNGKRKGKGRKSSPTSKPAANGAANGAAPKGDRPSSPGAPAALAAAEPPEPEAVGHVDAPGEEPPELFEGTHGAAWGAPLHRLDLAWTKLEATLLLVVLFAELASLSAWVLLNNLTEAPDKVGAGHSSDGTIFRGILGAIAVGCGVWFALKKQPLSVRRAATIGGILVGAAMAPAWASLGASYLDNLKVWLQEGSTLTLMGGLRGVATRLTLWLALLGGSLATGAGRQIHIDLVYRLLPKRLRLPATLLNGLAAAVVCFAGVWGFVDHIAITSFGSEKEAPASAKFGKIAHEMGDHLFLARKQVGLDLRSLPHVLAGNRYDAWMTGKDWNAWVDDAGFSDRWPAEQVQSIKVPDDTPTHTPFVLSPNGTNTRGLLVHMLGLVFPFGLFAIGLRFLLRMALTVSGHYTTDPEEAMKEELAAVRPTEGSV